jgi:hypothetical protein
MHRVTSTPACSAHKPITIVIGGFEHEFTERWSLLGHPCPSRHLYILYIVRVVDQIAGRYLEQCRITALALQGRGAGCTE